LIFLSSLGLLAAGIIKCDRTRLKQLLCSVKCWRDICYRRRHRGRTSLCVPASEEHNISQVAQKCKCKCNRTYT
jgi:hypothetical protein